MYIDELYLIDWIIVDGFIIEWLCDGLEWMVLIVIFEEGLFFLFIKDKGVFNVVIF